MADQTVPTFACAPGKPDCKYGLGCYRQNPDHWQRFNHPAEHAFIQKSSGKRIVQDTAEAVSYTHLTLPTICSV